MKMRILIFLLFSTLTSFAQQGFEWRSHKSKIVIPFQYVYNLIVLPVEVNGVKLSIILDTGAESSFIFSLPENDSIKFNDTKKTRIRGFGNSDAIDAIQSQNNKVNISGYTHNKFPFLIILNQNVNMSARLGIPVNGILNYSFFVNHIVEINYLKKQITLHKNRDFLQKKKIAKYEKLPISVINNRLYLEAKANINEKPLDLKLLIDIGLGSGLWLFESEKIVPNDVFFEDILGSGINGQITGKRSRVKELKIGEFSLANALVSYPYKIYLPKTGIVEGRNGSIGGEILKRFSLIFDYQGRELYLKKNANFTKPFNYNMSGIEVEHNGIEFVKETLKFETPLIYGVKDEHVVFKNNDFKYKFELKPVFEIASIRENSPADLVGLKVGDKIIRLNKKEIHGFTIEKINELLQSKEDLWIYIDIERNGMPIAYKFQLKKIL